VAEALSLVRLAPAWDQPSIRQELSVLLQAIAARMTDGVIYQGRNTLTRLTIAGREVVAKAFPAPRTLLKRLQRIGRQSKAVRAFDHAERMQRLGIGTPEPLATIAADDGRTWYVCAWADGCTTVRHINKQSGPEIDRLCADVGAFIGRMHQAGAYHFDNTPGNVLLREHGETATFLVVDCNRMRFGRIGAWAGLRSLVQLDWRGRLLDSYCAARGWNPARVRWMYHLRVALERWTRALKGATRPLRRKLGV
jgi:tRNA A-37 threonylcarbamoyl transferase component Bud32